MTFNDMLQHPSSMLYIFADEKTFIQKLDRKTAAIVRAKKQNQYQLLAAETGGYGSREEAAAKIRDAFVSMYGMTPGQALVKLAMGESVAGKNWAAGVYGVGAAKLRRPDFIQNSAITVDKKTGAIMVNGQAVQAKTVYGGTMGNKIQSYIYTAQDGTTYTSQRIGTSYYAGIVTSKDGKMQDANGATVTEADSDSVWTSCGSIVETVVNWLISLFGGGDDDDKELLSAENTLASQSDGFTTSTASTPVILVAALAGGYAISQFAGKKGKKGKKSKK